MPDDNIKIESFTVTYDSVKKEPKIEMVQEPYYLSEAEYGHLQRGDSKALTAGVSIFLASVGCLLILIAKLFTLTFINSNTAIEEWEWQVVWIGIALGLFIYFVFKWIIPSEKSKVMKNIKKHYKKSRPAKQYPKE
jgi:hypothetical protein